MRAPERHFPSFALVISSAYPTWSLERYPTRLPSYSCGCSERYHPYPKRLPPSLPSLGRADMTGERVFAYDVHDWGYPPPPAAPVTPTAPSPLNLNALDRPPSGPPPVPPVDDDSVADTVTRLEEAMDPYVDALHKAPVLRRRLSTLVIDLALSIGRRLKVSTPSTKRIRRSSISISLV